MPNLNQKNKSWRFSLQTVIEPSRTFLVLNLQTIMPSMQRNAPFKTANQHGLFEVIDDNTHTSVVNCASDGQQAVAIQNEFSTDGHSGVVEQGWGIRRKSKKKSTVDLKCDCGCVNAKRNGQQSFLPRLQTHVSSLALHNAKNLLGTKNRDAHHA